jgi:hypothetical protein
MITKNRTKRIAEPHPKGEYNGLERGDFIYITVLIVRGHKHQGQFDGTNLWREGDSDVRLQQYNFL